MGGTGNGTQLEEIKIEMNNPSNPRNIQNRNGKSAPSYSSSPTKRREMDLMKLMMSDYEVQFKDETNRQEFFVKFHGPKDTPYEGGVWKVRVNIPDNYPYSSPSIGFVNTIFHPNVDQVSGSVCLDVINQTWSPLFDLVNIFAVFLPQLLTYGNPSDPMNGEAATLMIKHPEQYKRKVQEFVSQYAQENNLDFSSNAMEDSDDDLDDPLSDGSASDMDDLDDFNI